MRADWRTCQRNRRQLRGKGTWRGGRQMLSLELVWTEYSPMWRRESGGAAMQNTVTGEGKACSVADWLFKLPLHPSPQVGVRS